MRQPRRAQAATAALRREIAGGQFGEAEVLPGERQLADLLRVSRTTLRRAMADLIEEGLLSQRQGLGTIIIRAAARFKPGAGSQEPKKTNGLLNSRAESRELARGFGDPTADEAMMLACAPGQPVFRISRLLLLGQRPLAIEHAAAPAHLLPASIPEACSLPAALAGHGYAAARSLKRLRSVPASPAEAEALEIAPDTLAILLHEAAILPDGRCCALTSSLHRIDRLDIVFGADPPVLRRPAV